MITTYKGIEDLPMAGTVLTGIGTVALTGTEVLEAVWKPGTNGHTSIQVQINQLAGFISSSGSLPGVALLGTGIPQGALTAIAGQFYFDKVGLGLWLNLNQGNNGWTQLI